MINSLINEDSMDEMIIIENVMDYAGLEVDEYTDMVIDRDLLTQLSIDGKVLKYSDDGYLPLDYDREIFYNPYRNYAAANNTFLHLLTKLQDRGEFYSPVHSIEEHDEDRRLKRLVVLGEDGRKLETEYYFNTNFIFIEMIYKLSGDNTTFKEIDEPY